VTDRRRVRVKAFETARCRTRHCDGFQIQFAFPTRNTKTIWISPRRTNHVGFFCFIGIALPPLVLITDIYFMIVQTRARRCVKRTRNKLALRFRTRFYLGVGFPGVFCFCVFSGLWLFRSIKPIQAHTTFHVKRENVVNRVFSRCR